MTMLNRKFQAVIIVALASSFYVYEFFLRVMPSVITDELMRDFSISASLMSTMTACFLYAYAAMQIPSGLLIDRFGPRRLLTIAIVVCAISTYLFQLSTHFSIGSFTRLLIGGASSFAFIAPLTLASRWFASKHFALIAGLIQLLGCIGAIAGGAPVAIIAHSVGWRQSLVYSVWIGIVLALLMWLIIRDWPPGKKPGFINHSKQQSEWQRLKIVCSKKQNWVIGIVAFATWSAMGAFAELWGVPFFMKKMGITAEFAADYITVVWVGVAIGSPLAGWWSNFIQSRRMPLLILLSMSFISSVSIIYLNNLNPIILSILLFTLGLAAGSQPITFALIADNNDQNSFGTAFGFNNMAVVSGAFLLQPLIGLLLDISWDGKIINQIPQYTINDYQFAFCLIPLASLIGLLLTYFGIYETLDKK